MPFTALNPTPLEYWIPKLSISSGLITWISPWSLCKRTYSPRTSASPNTNKPFSDVISTLELPDFALAACWIISPCDFSNSLSKSVIWISPDTVLRSKVLTATSRPVIPVLAVIVSTSATRSTPSSFDPSVTAPVEVNVTLPADVTEVRFKASTILLSSPDAM